MAPSPIERIESLEDDVAALYAAVAGLIQDPVVLVVNVVTSAEAPDDEAVEDTEPLPVYDRLERFITAERPVKFDFTDLNGVQTLDRCVSPYSIQGVWSNAVLVGWDHDKQAIRQFRVSGISTVTPTWSVAFRGPVE